MNSSIRILHLDDNARDAELIADKLELGGLQCEFIQAQDRESFETALAEDSFDIILCDYNLPNYDGITALKLAIKTHPGTPVILISGSLGEEEAVKALQSGATDYLLKQRLERLPAAVDRAVRQGQEHARRMRAEAELQASEERFRKLAEHSDEVFWFATTEPELVTYISPSVEKIWGIPAAQFYEDPRIWEKGIHPENYARVHAAYEDIIAGRRTKFAEEYRVIRPDSSVCWVMDNRTPIRDDLGKIVSIGGVVRNISEIKNAAEQLERAQRLESIGMLAAGIAHDFNNALAPIVMAGSLLRSHVQNPGAQRLLDAVSKSAARGEGLVKQLLSFASGSGGELGTVQLRHLLNEVCEMAETTFPKTIKIRSELPDNISSIEANASQIHQIFLNLCVNARDAMPDGGELTISATPISLDAVAAGQIPDARPGEFIAVEVRDTGTGIPPAVYKRIWEPFFTTKGQGKGTGLGLSTVRGIVHQHQGFIALRTKEGRGTSFTVYLPTSTGTFGARAGMETAELARGNGELILVADDEEPVRLLVEQVLTHNGYRVLAACDGADAIANFAPRAAEVALLLTDIQMPMLGGKALVTAVHRINPRLPVLFMSGASSRSNPDSSRQTTQPILAKPFQAETLLRIVRLTLDHAGPDASHSANI